MTTATDHNTVALDAARVADVIAEQYGEPEYMVVARRNAWDVFAAAPRPSRVDHLWRYTDPQPFEPGDTIGAVAPPASAPAVSVPHSDALAGYAVWHAQGLEECILDDRLAASGVVLTDLHRATEDHRHIVEQHLGSAVGTDFGKYEALNAAIWQAGLFVYVPRGVVVAEPMHVVFAGDASTPLFAARLLVVLEEGAQLTLTHEFVSPRGDRLSTNSVVESIVGANAHLRQVTVQRWGDAATAYITQRANVHRDGQFLSVFAGLGAGLSKVDLGARLIGRGANTKLLGMSFGQDQQHVDHHTVHDHQSSNTFSDLDFKVVLKDEARSVYTGLIRIAEEAAHCEAYQENRNLLLSNGTRADTIPELEILTDEARCSHGATSGPLDEAEIFYLRARGIPRDEAIRMVVGGFMEPTLREVPADLRERLKSYIAERVEKI